jgi:large subunit ribosomal protein L24
MKTQLKKGNTVKILSGDERGKTGEILEIVSMQSKKGFVNKRAIIKGLNLVKKHQKPTKENKGGIVSIEKSIHLSNLSLVKTAETKKKDVKKVDTKEKKETKKKK